MSRSISLITNSLEYYDNNCEKYNKAFSKIMYYSLDKSTSDTEHSKIKFYDKDKKVKFTSRYEVIGLYANRPKTWVWAWSVTKFSKNETATSKKLLNYALDIPSSGQEDQENRFLKTELVTSRFRITDPIQLDIHSAIASYISKIPVVFKLRYSPLYTGRDVAKYFIEKKEGKKNIKEVYQLEKHDNKITDDEYVVSYLFLLDFQQFE